MEISYNFLDAMKEVQKSQWSKSSLINIKRRIIAKFLKYTAISLSQTLEVLRNIPTDSPNSNELGKHSFPREADLGLLE